MTDYATVEQLQPFVGSQGVSEEVLEMAITAASAVIDQFTDNPFTEDIPAAITYACILQAARLVKRKDAIFGVLGSPEMGGEIRLLAKLDPDVQVLVRPYKRWWGAVGASESE